MTTVIYNFDPKANQEGLQKQALKPSVLKFIQAYISANTVIFSLVPSFHTRQ